jgi:uncharacterized membrane protein YfcA
MLFPISGVEVNPLIPFMVAFFVSFFTSMGGVSGAFLLLPFQVSFLGYTAPSVSGTNQVFNIVAIPSGKSINYDAVRNHIIYPCFPIPV